MQKIVIISFRIDGKPEDVLNPKKKQLEKITPVCFSFSGLWILFLIVWILSDAFSWVVEMANNFNYCYFYSMFFILHFLNLGVGSYESGFYHHLYAKFGREDGNGER